MSKTIVLKDERPVSWNSFYSGKHWKFRDNETKRVRVVVREVLTGEEELYQVPVDILVTGYFSEKPQDSDNICDKLYIDALKGWLLKDDDRKWVRIASTLSEVDKQNPRVEIQITEVQP